jgi:hypothetical protein
MAVVTDNQIIDNIDSFITNIGKLSKSYYMFVGHPQSWPDDALPLVANTSVEQQELSIYRDIVYGKLIANSDVSYMIRYVPWTSNTVYTQYSQYDGNLENENFYAITNVGEVYKCIFNNGNTVSTIRPALNTPSGTFTTSDGYIWKYMYTIDPASNTKFATTSYVPVTPNANVQNSAVPGTIDYIQLTDPGYNYQVYEEGFLLSVANNGYEVVLPNTSVQVDDYYTGSTIYLKAGGGAGQIRDVVQYSGADRRLRANTPFTVYVNMNLSNINGTINLGDTVTQNSVQIAHYYDAGYIYAGNNIVQSDTGAYGTVAVANSSYFVVTKNNSSNAFSLNLPFYNTAVGGVLKTGNVNIITGNNWVVANGGTAFATDYAVGGYIRVGGSANSQLRRITGVNSSVIIVDANTPFTSNLIGNVHYSVASASVPTSISLINRSGVVSYVNLTGVNINIVNTNPVGKQFFPGELVVQVDANNVNQGANAIVSFANDTVLQLSSVNGSLTANLYVLGQSSNAKAQISAVTSFPNITVSQPTGTFDAGQPVFSSSSGNATLVSYTTVPNSLTEYVISPKVAIGGDGNGALAYAYVDTSGANPSRQISSIVLINQGQNYTQANVVITSNNQYGSNAAAAVDISPLRGHGSNVNLELAAKYAGISVTFANGSNESYRFPITGQYRRVGILEAPTFNDAYVNLTGFDRVKLYTANNNGISFVPGEIVIQPYSLASNSTITIISSATPFRSAGIVVYSNSSYLELKNVSNTASGLPFLSNTGSDANTTVIGLISNAHAQVLTTAANNTSNSTVSYFKLLSNVEIFSDNNTGASATITQVVSNTQIRLSNILGHINGNDYVYDSVSNAYANIVSIYTSNGNIDKTSTFGHDFNQTCRIPLTSNTGAFSQFETVTQAYSNATGTVLTFNVDRDLVLSSTNGTFTTGDTLTDSNTSATAVVLLANSSYVRLTAANGVFGIGHTVVNQLNVGGLVSNVYPALVLYNVYNNFATGNNLIVGANSGSTGVTTLANTIVFPDLVRGSGYTSYLENILPFQRSNTSNEKINIVIKF